MLGSEESLKLAEILVRDIRRNTQGEGHLPGGYYERKSGWKCEGDFSYAPAQSGRMIRALLIYYKNFGDRVALDLAYELAVYNAKNCFEDDGTWKEEAGTHIHSINGLITSLIDLGAYLKNDFLFNIGRRAFDKGLKPYRSSFGWVQEERGTPHERGECNSSGDILQSAILLAKSTDTYYWEDAERILRNHLTASQLTEDNLFKDSDGYPDTKESIHSGVATRAIGGFFFTSPGDFKSHKEDRYPMNTDIVGAATEAICEAYKSAVTDDGLNLQISLLISKKEESYAVNSHIPEQGLLELIVTQPRIVFVRIPSWAISNTIRITVDNKKLTPVQIGSFISLCERPRRLKATIQFDLVRKSTSEILNGKEYKVEWYGDNVVSVKSPELFFKELY